MSPHVSRTAMLAGLLAVVGCSSSAPSPAARGGALVQIGPGGDPGENNATVCNVPTTTFGIPTLVEDRGVSPYVTAQDGSEDDRGEAARVRCAIRQGPTRFSVDAAITTSDGLAVVIAGTMSRTSSDTQATFQKGGATFVSQEPCSVDFSAADGMDIESGRVWAVVTCPRATDGRGNTCLASAAFVFEDCQQ
jgi:hypothetical protein